jgi:hypothetical protein
MMGFHRHHRRIESYGDLADAIRAASAVGSHGTAMLLAELLKGRIALLPCGATTSNGLVKQFIAGTASRPTVILAGFDDGCDLGPDAWPAARRARDWARWTLIHGAGFERWHYEFAISAAQTLGRVLVVECSGATLPVWEQFIRSGKPQPAGLTVRPRGPHPLPEMAEVLQ